MAPEPTARPADPYGGAPYTGSVPMVAAAPVSGPETAPPRSRPDTTAVQPTPISPVLKGSGLGGPLGPLSSDLDDDDDVSGNGLLIPVLIGVAALLAGLGGVFLLMQGLGDESQSVAAETDAAESAETDPAAPSATDEASAGAGAQSTEGETAESADAVFTEPTLLFAAADGPLERFTTYEIELAAAPENTLLQVVVDGIAQGTPAESLPNLILPEGRHTIEISMLDGDNEMGRSNSVEIYVFGAEPEAGYTANLSSVNIADEGWDEAIRRYDSFRSAGHERAIMLPLIDGYWSILVPGFGTDVNAVQEYCGSFGLAFPDQCFARTYNTGDYTPKEDPRPAAESTDGAASADGGAEQAPGDAEAEPTEATPADGTEDSGEGSMSDTEADGG